MPNVALPHKFNQQGFSYLEVLIASALIAIALVPGLDALQTGIIGTGIHQSSAVQQQLRLQKMDALQAESYANLLAAAKTAVNKTTATPYSDASGSTNRRLVYLALYDADADPFTLIDPNTDADNDLFTGSTSNQLWLRVATEGTAQGIETLVNR